MFLSCTLSFQWYLVYLFLYFRENVCVLVIKFVSIEYSLGLHDLFTPSFSIPLCFQSFLPFLLLLFSPEYLCIYQSVFFSESEISLVTSGVSHWGGELVDRKQTARNIALLGDIFWLLIAAHKQQSLLFPCQHRFIRGPWWVIIILKAPPWLITTISSTGWRRNQRIATGPGLTSFYGIIVENLGHWKSVGVTHSNNPSYEAVCESHGVKVAVGQSTPVAIMEGYSWMFSLN